MSNRNYAVAVKLLERNGAEKEMGARVPAGRVEGKISATTPLRKSWKTTGKKEKRTRVGKKITTTTLKATGVNLARLAALLIMALGKGNKEIKTKGKMKMEGKRRT